MKKKLNGIWHQGHVLCPKCLIQPGSIRRYGSDHQGYWFSAPCPHCQAAVHWHRDADLSGTADQPAQGEQLSLILTADPGRKKTSGQELVFPADRRRDG